MSDPRHAMSVDDLLRHSEFVRSLARSLVVDAARADDVVQDTWVVALETRTQPHELRSWLAGVVRHLVARGKRAASRRAQRERRAAVHEQLPATCDVVERLSIARHLVEAVLALQEPYRTTVLLRYFDHLPPRAIAKRLAIPPATVRTRLKRGLDALRAQLDRESGGKRDAWCLMLMPLAREASLVLGGAFARIAGGMLMSLSAKVTIGVSASLVLILAGWLAWQPADAQHDELASRGSPVPPQQAPALNEPRESTAESTRTEVGASLVRASSLTCCVRSKDQVGPPIAGATVSLVMRWQESERGEPHTRLIRTTASGADGIARFELAPSDLPFAADRMPPWMSLAVVATAAGHSAGEASVAWAADRQQTATIVLEPGRFLVGRVVDAATRAPLAADVRLGWGESDGVQAFAREDGSFAIAQRDQHHLIAFATDHIPGGMFIDADAAAQPVELALDRDTLTQPFEVVVLRADGEPDTDVFRVSFRPVGVKHAPPSSGFFAAAADVRLRSIHGAYNDTDLVIADGHDHRTDRDQHSGRFLARYLDPGLYQVRARLSECDVDVALGDVMLPPANGRLVLQLPKLAGIAGLVIGGEGEDGCWVQVSSGERRVALARVAQDASFHAIGLPSNTELRIEVQRGARLEPWIAKLVLAEGELRSDLRLELAPLPAAAVAAATPVPDLEYVVLDVVDRTPIAGVSASDGRGATVTSDAQGRFRLPGSTFEITLEKQGYLNMRHDCRDLAPSHEVLLVPNDRDRLLASGLFTWVEIKVAPASDADLAGQLTLLASDATVDTGWTLLASEMTPELERVASGWSGWMPSPSRASVGSRVEMALPVRLGVCLASQDSGAIGRGDAFVLPGAITTIEVTMSPSGEIAWQLRDAFTDEPHRDNDVELQFWGPPWIKPWRDPDGHFVARAVSPGRHRPQVNLLDREQARARQCQVRPAEVDVSAGRNALQQLTLIETIRVPIEVVRSDGSAWSPPEPVRQGNSWVTGIGTEAPRVIATPAQQMVGTESFPSATLVVDTEWICSGAEKHPRARYALELLVGESVTLSVADGDVASPPQTIRVARTMTPIALRLE